MISVSKKELLMDSMEIFYNEQSNIEKILPIINSVSPISLRILDWFITNYSKRRKIYLTPDKVDIYMHYKLKLKSVSKKYLDPFRRKNVISYPYGKNSVKTFDTSCGQLQFFKFAIETGLLDYVSKNLDKIEEDMKLYINKSKTINAAKKKEKEITIKAVKTVTNNRIQMIVSFD